MRKSRALGCKLEKAEGRRQERRDAVFSYGIETPPLRKATELEFSGGLYQKLPFGRKIACAYG
jgi:hypothetical protein